MKDCPNCKGVAILRKIYVDDPRKSLGPIHVYVCTECSRIQEFLAPKRTKVEVTYGRKQREKSTVQQDALD
jgi:DNA-directed RNA polymerase subunit M/transcription elongation factor TFIIS